MFLRLNGDFQVKAYDAHSNEIVTIQNPPESFANVYGSCYVSIGNFVYKIGGYDYVSKKAVKSVELFEFNGFSFTTVVKVSSQLFVYMGQQASKQTAA